MLALLLPFSLQAQTLPDLPPTGMVAEPSLPPPPAPPPPPSPAPVSAKDALIAQVGTRVAMRIQNPRAGSRDNLDELGSAGEADVVLTGKVHPFLNWQAGFVGWYGGSTTTSAAILDLVAKLDFADFLHLWLGRMPIPSDRASLSTVWGSATWTLPGRYDNYPPPASAVAQPTVGMRSGERERGDGATLWGEFQGGRYKYYLGVFGLDQPEGQSPLYSGRLCLSLLNPEPGFRTSSTYYGNKDILAFGFGLQHQQDGSLPPNVLTSATDDYTALVADLLFEKNGGTAGIVNVESSFTWMWGDNERAQYQLSAQLSYLLPVEIGIGRFQPLLRIQHAGDGSSSDRSDYSSIDAQLGYIIDGLNARLLGVYQYTKMQGQTENAIILGLQLLSRQK